VFKFLWKNNCVTCDVISVACLRSQVPDFIEPDNWPPNSPDLNPVDYSVCGGIAADGVSTQNF